MPVHFRGVITAAEEGRTEELRCLVTNGANVNEKDWFGKTALICASMRGHFECVKLLIDHGADVNEKSSYGYTALICASENGHFECVKLLIAHGANMNEKSFGGNTALMWASTKGHFECVKLLIDHGADESATNDKGKSALELSALRIKPELQRLFEEAAEKRTQLQNVCTACQCGECRALRQDAKNNANACNNLLNEVSNLKEILLQHQGMSSCLVAIADMVHKDYLPDYKRSLLGRIDANAYNIVTTMDPGPVIDRLWARNVITQEQYEVVHSAAYPTNRDKAAYVLRLVKFGPKFLVGIKKALEETNQRGLLCLFQ